MSVSEIITELNTIIEESKKSQLKYKFYHDDPYLVEYKINPDKKDKDLYYLKISIHHKPNNVLISGKNVTFYPPLPKGEIIQILQAYYDCFLFNIKPAKR